MTDAPSWRGRRENSFPCSHQASRHCFEVKLAEEYFGNVAISKISGDPPAPTHMPQLRKAGPHMDVSAPVKARLWGQVGALTQDTRNPQHGPSQHGVHTSTSYWVEPAGRLRKGEPVFAMTICLHASKVSHAEHLG